MSAKRSLVGCAAIATLLLLLLILIGVPASRLPSVVTDEGAEAERRVATQLLNRVASCRTLLDSNGKLQEGYEEGDFRWLDVDTSDVTAEMQNTDAVIVFVHGFNTSLADAIRNGNALWESLCEAGKIKASPERRIAFVTFCWRGDLNPERFLESQTAAKNSAPSLATLIQSLKEAEGERRVILVSHSLGARVALQTLHDLQEKGSSVQIDCLLMVQGAVPWGSIYSGSVDFYVHRPVDPRRPGTMIELPPTTEPWHGEYAACIQLANHLVVVSSYGDPVLGKWYYLSQQSLPHVGGHYLPNVLQPIGQPLSGGKPVVRHPRFEVIDFSPQERKQIQITDHSQVFKDQALVAFLWSEVLAEHTVRTE